MRLEKDGNFFGYHFYTPKALKQNEFLKFA